MDQGILQERTTLAPAVRPAGEGRALNVLGAPYLFKISSTETGNRFSCIECTVPAGSGVPPHTHTHEDEAFYVLAGEVTFESAGDRAPLRLGPGSFFFGPRGHQHCFHNASGKDARMLVFCVPGSGMERMFTDLDAATRQSGGMPPVEEIVAIAARYGVSIAQAP